MALVYIGSEWLTRVFDRKNEPAAFAESGDTVRFACCDAYGDQIVCDHMDYTLMDEAKGHNPVTGPLYVRGAEPGDVLKVEIENITLNDYGVMRVGPGTGTYEVERFHCRRFPIREGKVLFDRGVEIPLKPMVGVVGTCPQEALPSVTPGVHGGNLDVKDLGVGTTVYLPVEAPGALLAIGDLHAVQGDGETACCAIEAGGSVTVRVSVLKGGCDLPLPFLETENSCCTLAADASLDVCSAAAARAMHGWLMQRFGLSDVQAAMLLSLQGELRISQVVNPRKGCIMEIPKAVLRRLEETKA